MSPIDDDEFMDPFGDDGIDDDLDRDREGVPADIFELIDESLRIVDSAKSMPLSSSILISRDEIREILEDIRVQLPEEIRSARWLLKEGQEYIEKAKRDADSILEEARVQAERMAQRTEIVRQAKKIATKTVDDADAAARKLKREAEDYCDRKLAAFEIALEDIGKTVKAGRDRLQLSPREILDSAQIAGGQNKQSTEAEEKFFDQDLTE